LVFQPKIARAKRSSFRIDGFARLVASRGSIAAPADHHRYFYFLRLLRLFVAMPLRRKAAAKRLKRRKKEGVYGWMCLVGTPG
jgi:hypothetical protein